MAIEDWETLPDGTLRLLPLLDARVAKSPLQVFARLQFAHLPDGSKKPELRHLQLGMTPAQARQLAQALLDAVARIDQEVTGEA